MNQMRQLLARLTGRQKATLAAAVALVAGLLWFGVEWNRERDLRPLYTNLVPEDAGSVVERLRSANVKYKVAENGTILVPSARVAELRLDLAAAGLPKTGRMGFELFDKANLGTTDFAEQVNFRRAIEGELERSVMALSEVERARVHVTFSRDSIFTESRQPAKASVMLKLRAGAKLAPQSILAIQHLASSAVEGLTPEHVSVLDMNGNLLGRARLAPEEDAGGSAASQDYRQGVERDYLAKIRATLDPLLGPEKYRAGVSAECDFSSAEQSEESFDPGRSVMVSAQKTEDLSNVGGTGGVPGTASNLPRPAPKSGSTSGGVSRKTESIAYQTSRMVKHTRLPQGALKRLSVAVLVDQTVRWEGAGNKARRILEPPPADRLKVVRDVIAGVVGLQPDRGDQLLVETLPFEATLALPPPEAPAGRPAGGPQSPRWFESLLKQAPLGVWLGAAGALAVVFVVGLIVLVRRLLRGRQAGAAPRTVMGAAAGAAQLAAGEPGGDFETRALAMLAENNAARERQENETLESLRMPTQTKKGEVLKKVILEQAKKDPAAIAQLIRTWLTEKEH